MPDSSGFKKHEVPPQPRVVDFESILEKGEIKKAEELKGSWGIRLIDIKDDGSALFRPDKETDFMFEANGMESKRSDLELLADRVDQVLGFDLVPAVVNRVVGSDAGSLQRRIQNYSAHNKEWWNKVKPEEIIRAAVFDYLIDAKDRHDRNFIIDSDTGKLWLIDHDFYMFFDEIRASEILDKAIEQGLIVLGESEKASLERFLAQSDSLMAEAKLEVVQIIKKAQDRAKILLEKGQIPA